MHGVAAQERDYVAVAMRILDATDGDEVDVWLEELKRSGCMRGIGACVSRTTGGEGMAKKLFRCRCVRANRWLLKQFIHVGRVERSPRLEGVGSSRLGCQRDVTKQTRCCRV